VRVNRELYAAICRQPGENTPRLAFADWLDELDDRDESEAVWAEAIRKSILEGDDLSLYHKAVRRRGLRGLLPEATLWDAICLSTLSLSSPGPRPLTFLGIDRGFPGVARLPGPSFLIHAPALALSCPLSGVRLTARTPHIVNRGEPNEPPNHIGWRFANVRPTPPGEHVNPWPNAADVIPEFLWDLAEELRDKPRAEDPEDSLRWLSWACVRYARRLAYGEADTWTPRPDSPLYPPSLRLSPAGASAVRLLCDTIPLILRQSKPFPPVKAHYAYTEPSLGTWG
jgi:uncharacterized protein (TIGR02996 family)